MIIFQKVQNSCWGSSHYVYILDRRGNEGHRMLHNICTFLVISFVTKLCKSTEDKKWEKEEKSEEGQRCDSHYIPYYASTEKEGRTVTLTLIFRMQRGWGGTGSSIPSSAQELSPGQPAGRAPSLYMSMFMGLHPGSSLLSVWGDALLFLCVGLSSFFFLISVISNPQEMIMMVSFNHTQKN